MSLANMNACTKNFQLARNVTRGLLSAEGECLFSSFTNMKNPQSTDRHFKRNILQIIDEEREADFFFYV